MESLTNMSSLSPKNPKESKLPSPTKLGLMDHPDLPPKRSTFTKPLNPVQFQFTFLADTGNFYPEIFHHMWSNPFIKVKFPLQLQTTIVLQESLFHKLWINAFKPQPRFWNMPKMYETYLTAPVAQGHGQSRTCFFKRLCSKEVPLATIFDFG